MLTIRFFDSVWFTLVLNYVLITAEPSCNFTGQCEYNVVVGHCAKGTQIRTKRDTGCSCADVTELESDTDRLMSVIHQIQRDFESVSADLNKTVNEVERKQLQLKSLQQDYHDINVRLQNTAQSTNETKARLETEKQLATDEKDRLTAALALTLKDLVGCNATLMSTRVQPTNNSETHLTYCGFEDSNMCGYTREGSTHMWKIGTGSVDSSTGPRADHTYGSPTGSIGGHLVSDCHYMYLDAKQEATSSSTLKMVRMTSPLQPPSTGYCLRFWYNMYGQDIKTLKVYAKINGGVGLGYPIYTHTGPVDRDWHVAEVSLDSEYTAHSFSFVFEATTNARRVSHTSHYSYITTYSTTGDKGDIAVDDIYIYNTSCSQVGFTYQYLQMNALLKRNENTSIAFVGFPCNQFGLQEPAANKTELLNGLRYVRPGNGYVPDFDIMKKIDVNGPNESPFYTYLKESCRIPDSAAFNPRKSFWVPIKPTDVVWNFEKFIIDKSGYPRFRLLPKVAPDDIENLLVAMTMEEPSNNATVAADINNTINSTLYQTEMKYSRK